MKKSKADRIVYDLGEWAVVKGKKVWISRGVFGTRSSAQAFKLPHERVRRMEAFHIKARE
jgi:hypothetical protein